MKKFIISLMITLVPITLNAEPSPTVNYLMNEPATMFDLGMYRLEEYLNKYPFKSLKDEKGIDVGIIFVSYHWGENRIIIKASPYTESYISAKDMCKIMTNKIKTILGIGEEGVLSIFTKKRIGNFFQHNNFRTKEEPYNFINEIEKIVEIRVEATRKVKASKSKKNDKEYETNYSICPLLYNQISFVE